MSSVTRQSSCCRGCWWEKSFSSLQTSN